MPSGNDSLETMKIIQADFWKLYCSDTFTVLNIIKMHNSK
jgi:hypothetical protein